MLFTTTSGEDFIVQTPIQENQPNQSHFQFPSIKKENPEEMSPAMLEKEGYAVAIPEVPVTEERKPFILKEGDTRLKSPGTARANIASSLQHPQGTTQSSYSQDHSHQTVLQQHISFFDLDNDNIIWPQDTFLGFHRLGYSLPLCILSVLVIHLNFSYPTVKGWLPDPFFRIYVERIHKDKHGSDSGTYDNEGRFIPQKFEDVFEKFGSGDKQGLYGREILNYLKAQRVVFDFFGWGGAVFEWAATWILLWPEDGRIMKEDVRGIYDGSLFFEIAERREKKKV